MNNHRTNKGDPMRKRRKQPQDRHDNYAPDIHNRLVRKAWFSAFRMFGAMFAVLAMLFLIANSAGWFAPSITPAIQHRNCPARCYR